MACVGIMLPQIGKSVRCADMEEPEAFGAHVALSYRSVGKWVHTARLGAGRFWAAAVHQG